MSCIGIGTGSVSVGFLLIDIVMQVKELILEILNLWQLSIVQNGRDGLSKIGGDDSGGRLVSS